VRADSIAGTELCADACRRGRARSAAAVYDFRVNRYLALLHPLVAARGLNLLYRCGPCLALSLNRGSTGLSAQPALYAIWWPVFILGVPAFVWFTRIADMNLRHPSRTCTWRSAPGCGALAIARKKANRGLFLTFGGVDACCIATSGSVTE
jgi:hypothetical protein